MNLKVCAMKCSETDHPYTNKIMWNGVVNKTLCVDVCPGEKMFVDDGVCVPTCTSKYFAVDKSQKQQYSCVAYCHAAIKQDDGMYLCVTECPSDKPFLLDGLCVPVCPQRLYTIVDYSSFRICISSCDKKTVLDLDHFNHKQCVDDCSEHELQEYGLKCFKNCGTEYLQVGLATCGKCEATQFLDNGVCVTECPKFYSKESNDKSGTCVSECDGYVFGKQCKSEKIGNMMYYTVGKTRYCVDDCSKVPDEYMFSKED